MNPKFEGGESDLNFGFIPPLYKILIGQLHCIICSLFLSLFSVVTIGFDAAAYTFTETDRTVSRSVSASVQSGSLARDVVVTVQTVDGSATGGNLINTQTL